jgi:predicted transcriptional regulator of viral defense system
MSTTASRTQLADVIRSSGDLITVDAACAALGSDRAAAAKTLARWAKQGWLRRLRRGLYAAVPLAARPEDSAVEDAWRLVPRLFSPGYIGGATAAHHWDLTEQLFRSVFVFTARKIRKRELEIQGAPFVLRHRAERLLFGTRSVWRGTTKVDVSDLHRTIVDMLDDPSTGGGIRQVADCLRAYLGNKEADLAVLLDYAGRVGNGAIYKRLGFLLEREGKAVSTVAACRGQLTEGAVKLDPGVPSPRLVTRWRLWVPEAWKAAPGD